MKKTVSLLLALIMIFSFGAMSALADNSEKDALAERIRNFIDRLMELDGEQTIFDEMLWGGIMEHMTVYEKGKATFTFVGGIEVTVC